MHLHELIAGEIKDGGVEMALSQALRTLLLRGGLGFFGLIFLWPLSASGHPLKDAYRAFERQQYETAETHFRQHIGKHPTDWPQVYNAGVASFQRGQFEEAQKLFDQVRQSPDPELRSRAAYNSAICDIMRRRYGPAEQSLLEALSYDNSNAMIKENLEWVRKQKSQRSFEEPPQPQSEQKSAEKQDETMAQESTNGQGQSQDQKNAQEGQEKHAQNQSQGQTGQERSSSQKQSVSQANPSGEQSSSEPSQAGQPSTSDQKAAQATKGSGQNKPEVKSQEAQGAAPEGQQPGEKPDEPLMAEDAQGQEQKDTPAQKLGPGGKMDPSAATQSPSPGDKIQLFERQDAEAKLRSIEDQIGRYPIQIEGGDGQQGGQNDKQW